MWYIHTMKYYCLKQGGNPVTSYNIDESKGYDSDGKESTCSARDLGSVLGLGRSPGEGNALQYSCLENLMNRGGWRATVHGVAKSRTQLSDQHFRVKGCNSM